MENPVKKISILVVEDETIIGMDIRETLVDLGYDVPVVVASGEEVIDRVGELKPDLLLMDIVLSGKIDGIEAAKIIHEEVDIPVVFLTSHMEGDTFQRARETSPYGYIMKPAGKDNLYSAIEMALHRHELEKELRESEDRYRALFENSLNIVYLFDFQGNLLDANDAALNIVGYARDDIPRLNFASFLEGAYLQKAYGVIDEIRETGVLRQPAEYQLKRKDGSYMWINTTASVIRRSGEPYAVQAVAMDITERKRNEEAANINIDKLRKSMNGIIQAMTLTVEIRDPYTAGHQKKVANLARAIANEIGLQKDQVDGIRTAGLIHDLGKINVPSEILTKPGRINDNELSLIKSHPRVGYDILKAIEFPWPVAQIVYQHHERMDGSGYPEGLRDKDILMEAKVIGVADVVEAMASHRPYRPAFGVDAALDEISKHSGVLYEPDVVDACHRLVKEKNFRIEIASER